MQAVTTIGLDIAKWYAPMRLTARLRLNENSTGRSFARLKKTVPARWQATGIHDADRRIAIRGTQLEDKVLTLRIAEISEPEPQFPCQ
jgi:hypothetical protein